MKPTTLHHYLTRVDIGRYVGVCSTDWMVGNINWTISKDEVTCPECLKWVANKEGEEL